MSESKKLLTYFSTENPSKFRLKQRYLNTYYKTLGLSQVVVHLSTENKMPQITISKLNQMIKFNEYKNRKRVTNYSCGSTFMSSILNTKGEPRAQTPACTARFLQQIQTQAYNAGIGTSQLNQDIEYVDAQKYRKDVRQLELDWHYRRSREMKIHTTRQIDPSPHKLQDQSLERPCESIETQLIYDDASKQVIRRELKTMKKEENKKLQQHQNFIKHRDPYSLQDKIDQEIIKQQQYFTKRPNSFSIDSRPSSYQIKRLGNTSLDFGLSSKF